MGLLFAISPILVVAFGALLLMLVEAFSGGAKKNGDIALGTAVTLFAGAAFSIAAWMIGADALSEASVPAPCPVSLRFALFFDFVICLGGAMAALLAGGYMPERGIER